MIYLLFHYCHFLFNDFLCPFIVILHFQCQIMRFFSLRICLLVSSNISICLRLTISVCLSLQNLISIFSGNRWHPLLWGLDTSENMQCHSPFHDDCTSGNVIYSKNENSKLLRKHYNLGIIISFQQLGEFQVITKNISNLIMNEKRENNDFFGHWGTVGWMLAR